jgi:hypothetical protein
MAPTELTREQRIARHKDFLRANGETIAAFSWGGYLKDGKGAVLVPEEDFVHLPTPQLKGLRFAYAAKDSDLLGEISTHFEQKEWSWLDSYDPDEKAIVIILREGGGTSGYLIGGRTRPSEAWARQKAKDN